MLALHEEPPFWTPGACRRGGRGSRASAGDSDGSVRSPGENDSPRRGVRGNGAHPSDSGGHGKTTRGLVLEQAEQTGVFRVDRNRLAVLARAGTIAWDPETDGEGEEDGTKKGDKTGFPTKSRLSGVCGTLIIGKAKWWVSRAINAIGHGGTESPLRDRNRLRKYRRHYCGFLIFACYCKNKGQANRRWGPSSFLVQHFGGQPGCPLPHTSFSGHGLRPYGFPPLSKRTLIRFGVPAGWEGRTLRWAG